MKPIPGYEGLYSIDMRGNVYSHRTNRVLSTKTDRGGYLAVTLYGPDGPKTRRVHRLVAMAYIENPHGKKTVDHINRIRTDNRVENLRWATSKEQMKNVDIEKRKAANHKGCIRAAEARSRAVQARDPEDHNVILARFRSSCEASRQLFGDASKNSLINRCARGQVSRAYGYLWTFATG